MSIEVLALLVLAGAALLGGGYALGRRSSAAAEHARELQMRLEALSKERDQALAELAAAREATQRAQAELDGYRGQVVEHFSGTSELLRDLTHQYRAVYEHLTQGANALCPEGFAELGGGPPELASEGEGVEETPADDADPERDTSPAG